MRLSSRLDGCLLILEILFEFSVELNKIMKRKACIDDRGCTMITSLRNSMTVILVLILGASVGASSSSGLSPDDRKILETIEQSNRANRELLQSFDMKYSSKITVPAEGKSAIDEGSGYVIDKSGRYAFSGDKEYGEENIANSNRQLLFVRNGSQVRMRKTGPGEGGSVGIGTYGKCKLRPGTPDPWTLIDNGLSTRLTSLDPDSEGEVVRVERLSEKDRQYVKVVIEKPMEAPDGSHFPVEVNLTYSAEYGYTLKRLSCEFYDKWVRQETYREFDECTEIKRYNVNGNEVFLPVKRRCKTSWGENLTSQSMYEVDAESVRLNPELPEDMFKIEIRPDDAVVNMDVGVEIEGPVGVGRRMMPRAEEDDLSGLVNELTRHKDNSTLIIKLCDDVQIKFVYIPPGSYMMGSPEDEISYPPHILRNYKKKGMTRSSNEGPQHRVSIPSGFYMGIYEITCGQYRCYEPDFWMGTYEGYKQDGNNHPVCLDWDEAKQFCDWLSEVTGLHARLPSEEEWEYACRAGSQDRFFWGSDIKEAGKYANAIDAAYKKRWPDRVLGVSNNDGYACVAPVGQFLPNDFGLYDMIGNVPEWCRNPYCDDAYKEKERKR